MVVVVDDDIVVVVVGHEQLVQQHAKVLFELIIYFELQLLQQMNMLEVN